MTTQNTTETGHVKFAVLAADVALFTLQDDKLLVRLVKVQRSPHFKGMYALPGGLLLPSETAEEAIERLIEDRGAITSAQVYTEQLYTFSEVNRDPLGRVVSVGYIGLIPWSSLSPSEQKGSEDALWVPVKDVVRLAYDHTAVLQMAVARLRSRVVYTTLLSKLMPVEFTLSELQKGYEVILNKPLDKRNFRKKMLKLKVVKSLAKERRDKPSRPAQLFRFAGKVVQDIEVI